MSTSDVDMGDVGTDSMGTDGMGTDGMGTDGIGTDGIGTDGVNANVMNADVMSAAVITCSTRSAAGERDDISGQVLADGLVELGVSVVFRSVVPDDLAAIRLAVAQAVEAEVAVVLTTGGTGLTPTDITPEAIEPLLDKQIPGIAEAIRLSNRESVPTSVLSRGIAGSVGTTLIVTLPGSPGGVRDSLAVLAPILRHAVAQLAGSDHRVGGGV